MIEAKIKFQQSCCILVFIFTILKQTFIALGVSLDWEEKPSRLSHCEESRTMARCTSISPLYISERVTREVCEKVAQNVAQPMFCQY
jgi:hypothetical protein